MYAASDDVKRLNEVLRSIEDALADNGWYAGESILGERLTRGLAEHVSSLSSRGELQPARIGQAGSASQHIAIRSDETQWIDGQTEVGVERDALQVVSAIRESLNQSLFLGARSAELHFARYAAGAFYRTHRDRFRSDDARVLSLVFYLNDQWTSDDGGELVLYSSDDSGGVIARVEPRIGTMVCFRSEQFPHEVLPGRRERYSLTGWLRRDWPAA